MFLKHCSTPGPLSFHDSTQKDSVSDGRVDAMALLMCHGHCGVALEGSGKDSFMARDQHD